MRTLLVVLFCTVIIAACQKSNSQKSNTGITGRWQLKEYWANPGNQVAPVWTPATTNETAEFTNDGRIISSQYLYGNMQVDRYRIKNDSMMVLGRSAQKDSFATHYTLTDTELTIYLPCIEGCGYRYKR